MDLAIWYAGVAVLSVALLALIAGTILCIAVVVIHFTPRLHIGRPQNDGELCFYDPRVITTGKGDKRIEGERRPIAAPLRIKWWVGLSRRNSAKWFVGFIRWDPQS